MAFQKGNGGRPKGALNKGTIEVRERCKALIEDPVYMASFIARLQAKELPPALEQMAWHYAYGKPIERHELSGPQGGPIAVHDHLIVDPTKSPAK